MCVTYFTSEFTFSHCLLSHFYPYYFLWMPCFCFKCNFKSYFHEHENVQSEQRNCLLIATFVVQCGGIVDFFGANNKGMLLAVMVVVVEASAATVGAVRNDVVGMVYPVQLLSMSRHLNNFRIVTSGSKRMAHGVADVDGETIDAFVDDIDRCNESVKI